MNRQTCAIDVPRAAPLMALHRHRVLRALLLLAAGCGSRTPLDSGQDVRPSFELCDEYVMAFTTSSCFPTPPEPGLVQGAMKLCRNEVLTTPPACKPAMQQFYECFGRLFTTCAVTGLECAAEERQYAECLSSGSCHRLGGGQGDHMPRPTNAASIFTNEEVCRCTTDFWDAGSPGQKCTTWEQCTPVCCSCPGSTHKYTAAVCDFAGDPSLQSGTCASSEHACDLSNGRCALSQ